MPEPTVLLTFDEVAARLRKTKSQLYWMRSQGKAPKFATIGGRLLASEAEVDRFVAEAFEAAS